LHIKGLIRMIDFPLIITGYNSSGKVTPIKPFIIKLPERLVEKLKDLSIYLRPLKKGELMLCIFRTEFGFPDILGCEEFCYYERFDTVEGSVEKLINKFYSRLQERIETAQRCFGIDVFTYKRKE